FKSRQRSEWAVVFWQSFVTSSAQEPTIRHHLADRPNHKASGEWLALESREHGRKDCQRRNCLRSWRDPNHPKDIPEESKRVISFKPMGQHRRNGAQSTSQVRTKEALPDSSYL